jgi:glutathione peroxidase
MPNVHDFTVKTIQGADKKLAEYKGNVLLVVNVASECGYTPQYEGLEKLHERYAARGLRVLGFPCNDFGAQEPGTESEILAFCTSKFGVKFDMFGKVKVKGEGMTPLFDYLQAHEKHGGAIKWNFGKFLVGKDGEVVARFEHKVAPESAELATAIEEALG